MSTTKRVAAGAAAALAVVVSMGSAAQAVSYGPNLLQNSGFENPDIANGTKKTFTNGQSVGAWKVHQINVDVFDTAKIKAHGGRQSLDLNGDTTGAVCQTRTLVKGATYRLSGFLGANPNDVPKVKTGFTLVQYPGGGSHYKAFSIDGTGATVTNPKWQWRSFIEFTAQKTTADICVMSSTSFGAGPLVDDLSLQRKNP